MEFADPPPEKRGQRSTEWIDRVRAMQEHPGEWAKVGNYSPGVATNIRKGRYKMFLDGFEGDEAQRTLYMKRHWEIVTRKTNDGGRNDIFIRWLG